MTEKVELKTIHVHRSTTAFRFRPPRPSSLAVDIALHQAAREGQEDVVRQWMEWDRSAVDAEDSEGYTAFHYAARYHHFNVMRILEAYGADPQYCRQKTLKSALHLACKPSPKYSEQETQAIKESIMHLVEELKLDVNQGDDHKRSPLHCACFSGNKPAVEFLLNHRNIQLCLMDDWERSVIHTSCDIENTELLQLLLEKLEEKGKLTDLLPLRDVKNRTALDFAFTNGCLPMASKLLEFARNNEFSEIDAHLVLDCSQGKETDDIVKFLNTCNLKCLSHQDDGASILHLLAGRGWVRAAKAVAVKDSSLLNEKDSNGQTPLHYAAAKNHRDIVKHLMDLEITEVDAVDVDGCTPLLVAARRGCSEAFVKLLEKADVSKTDRKGRNAVFLAAEADHSTVMEAAKGKDATTFTQADCSGNTPLHAAAASGSEKALKVLLDQHVIANARNGDGRTPLHLAALNGHNTAVESLLAYVSRHDDEPGETAVDISARDKVYADTPLHLAAYRGHCSVAVTLLEKGANIRARNSDSQTPLHGAAIGGHQEMVELLISDYGAEMEVRNVHKRTPLHLAIRWGHSDVVATLLRHASHTRHDRRHAVKVAIESGAIDYVNSLLKKEDWEEYLEYAYQKRNSQTTPMREIIKNMPEVALEVLNKCTRDDFNDNEPPHSSAYEVEFDYKFIEDFDTSQNYSNSMAAIGSTEEGNVISQQQHGLNCRPSYLLNRLSSRLCKCKFKRGQQHATWGPTVYDKANHPLQLMVDNKRTKLLNHPLVSTLVAYKWKRVWPLYLANLLFYLVFLSFLTAYALVVPNPQSELCLVASNPPFNNSSIACEDGSNATAYRCGECNYNKPFLYAAGAIVLLCVLVRITIEFIQLLEEPGRYFFYHENWLEIFLYSFTVIFMSSLGSVCVCPKPWQWQIGALAVFLAWIQLSIFVRRLPQLGLYIIMFENIVLTFVKLAIPALLLVLAFSMAFYMMFFVPSPLFAASPFATPGLSIIKAMTMAVGEMDFETIFRLTSGGVGDIDEVPTPIPYPRVSILLWIFFLILMPILLMNLLTGLAVGDVDRIQSEAEYREQKLQIESILNTEEALQAIRSLFIPLDKNGYKKIRIKPNRQRGRQLFFSLLAGVGKSLTGVEISKSLSNPTKYIEIEHVHEQTSTLLAKVADQGTQQGETAKLNAKTSQEIAEVKVGMEKMKTSMATYQSEQRAEMAELRTEVNALKRAMSEQLQRMEVLLLRGLAGREGTGGAGLVGEEGHSSATT